MQASINMEYKMNNEKDKNSSQPGLSGILELKKPDGTVQKLYINSNNKSI